VEHVAFEALDMF
jgi:hypothetical protein